MTYSVLSKFLSAGIGALLLSATVVGSASAAGESGKIRSLQISDYISQEDSKKAPVGYRLNTKGIGDVLVKELRVSKASGKKCKVEKRSRNKVVRSCTFSLLGAGPSKACTCADHPGGPGQGCDSCKIIIVPISHKKLCKCTYWIKLEPSR